MFKKWYTTCFKTYADVFIRLIAIYFALYMIGLLTKSGGNAFVVGNCTNNDPNCTTRSLTLIEQVFIILGLLMFAKQLPDLLKDLLGIDLKGNFTLNPMKKMADIPVAGRLFNTAYGGVQELIKGNGFRGFANNWNNIPWSGDKSKSILDTNYRKLKQEMKQKQDPLRSKLEGTNEIDEMRKLWDEGDEARNKLKAEGVANGKLDYTHSYAQYKAVYKNKGYIDALMQKNNIKHWNEELEKSLSIADKQMGADPNGTLTRNFRYHSATGQNLEIDSSSGEIWEIDAYGARMGIAPLKIIGTSYQDVYSEIKDEMNSSNGALQAAEAKLESAGKRYQSDARTTSALKARKNPIRP